MNSLFNKSFCYCHRFRTIVTLCKSFSNQSKTNDTNDSNDNNDSDRYQTNDTKYSTFDSIRTALNGKSLTQLLKEASDEAIDSQMRETSDSELSRQTDIRDQTSLSVRPKVAPEDTSVILFPGQGSQFVGMGYNLLDSANVDQMFAIAKRILGYDLLDLCLNGPIETLNRTQYCQPAIFVTSLAAVERLRSKHAGQVESCVATAGFSVGELAALVFAGALSYEDGLRLVKIRAEAMQYASELVPSAMLTVFFNADARIKFGCRAAIEWCIRKGIEPELAVCSVANYLFPHCKVMAGHEEAINFLQMNAKDFGIKKTKRVPVSGAFHTSLMAPARQVLANALKQIKLEVPLIPVHSNFDATIYRDVDSIRKKLSKQMTSPVRWEQILHTIYERPKDTKYPKTYECGPGSTLLATLGMVNGRARRSAHHISA